MKEARKKQTLSAPPIGDVLAINGRMHEVFPPCDNSHNGRWYCITHDERFENQLQKDIHISSGKHKLAWVCFEHGLEVDPKWFPIAEPCVAGQ